MNDPAVNDPAVNDPASRASGPTETEAFAAAERLLERLVAISSPSGDRVGLERCARVYAQALEAQGLVAEIESSPDDDGLPILHARSPTLPPHDAEPSTARAATGHLLAIGHLDTVLRAGPVRRESDPDTDTDARSGERLIATGAVDMKGGLAALVGALDLLRRDGRRCIDDLRVAVVPDEEIAGPITHRVVRALGPRARVLWSLEPGRASSSPDGETLVLGRRGRFSWSLDVRGRGAHSGSDFWDGRSALGAAAAWWLAAEALTGPEPAGPTINAGRMVAGERAFVEDLASGADLLFSRRQINVVPDRTRLEGEARYLRAAEGETLQRQLRALTRSIAAEREVELELWIGEVTPPLEPSDAARAWATRAAERAAARGWRLGVEDDRGGLSFPNFLEDPQAVVSLDGLGPTGGGLHTRDEWVDLGSLRRRIVLLADLLDAG